MANGLVLLGAGSSGSNGSLTPPSVAPVLTVDADLGSYEANLSWTASNKTSSAGFGYAIWRNDLTGSGWTLQGTVGPETLTFSNDVGVGNDNTYLYYVIPFNDAGEGPSSNTASVVLPGEFNRLLLNAGGNLLLNQTGDLLING